MTEPWKDGWIAMPLTSVEPLMLSNNVLFKESIAEVPEIRERLQALLFIPFLHVQRDRLLGTASVALTCLTQDVVVSQPDDGEPAGVDSRTLAQVRRAVRSLLQKFATLLVRGDSANPGEFDGLRKLADPTSQTIRIAAGTALTLDHLRQLVNRVGMSHGRPHVLIASSVRGIRKVLEAHRSAEVEPEYVEIQVPDRGGGRVQEKCLSFHGIPIFSLDPESRPDDETFVGGAGESFIWAASLGPDGLHGILPESVGDKFIRASRVSQSGGKSRIRVSWPVGLVLETPSALACLGFDSATGAESS